MINYLLRIEFKKSIWLKIMRKISRIFKIYFVITKYEVLPKNNHPLTNLENIFKQQYLNFNNKKKLFNRDIFLHLKKNFKYNNKIKFLDYGGENIDLYMFLKNKFPKIYITVINQSSLNFHLKKFLKKKKLRNINVLSNKSKLKNMKFDYVNFGSSLQYIQNYENLLKTLLSKNIKFCNVAATSFFNDKSLSKIFVVKQVNLLPTIMYCYFFNFYNFRLFFKKFGYEIKQQKVNSFKKIKFKNFNTEVKHLDILFKKIK